LQRAIGVFDAIKLLRFTPVYELKEKAIAAELLLTRSRVASL
jgi:hypothetical protein